MDNLLTFNVRVYTHPRARTVYNTNNKLIGNLILQCKRLCIQSYVRNILLTDGYRGKKREKNWKHDTR